MEEFLESLYNYEYFGFYLIISIIVLVLLFLVILFFGKKDQKVREIEATKKLQQINSEAFKEEQTEEKVEVNTLSEDKLENDTIIVPSIEDIPSINNVDMDNEIPDAVIPVESVLETEENVISVNAVKDDLKIEEKFEEPILERIEERPFVFENTNIFENNFVEPVVETPIIEDKELVEEIEVPKFNFEKIVEEAKKVEEEKQPEIYTKGPQIFSSVYVPERKEEIEAPKVEDAKIEMPLPKSNDESDFELPVLKKEEVKEEKIEVPVLNDYDLDNLSGETYTINK